MSNEDYFGLASIMFAAACMPKWMSGLCAIIFSVVSVVSRFAK